MTNAENPLKPFDTLPKSATDLNSLDCDYNENDDSFKVVFEGMMINLTEIFFFFKKQCKQIESTSRIFQNFSRN